MTAAAADPRAVVEAVWRLESARIVAGLARLVRDLDLAEELAQDALIAALEEWPRTGVPSTPGAWLMLTARHRAIDRLRRNDRLTDNLRRLGHDLLSRPGPGEGDFDAVLAETDLAGGVQDDLLRLIFAACHPALSVEAQIALTLRVLGGLSTDEIARAYLTSEATIAQRIVRAKRMLRQAGATFELPPAGEQVPRLAAVLHIVYLIFNEGYTATSGADWTRPELCYEALRLGRMLATWAVDEPEVHGLAALMEIQSSRLRVRTTPDGTPIPLLEQNRTRWDHLLIRRGFQALLLARQHGAAGPYVLQAAIAACHASARRAEDTDWPQIVRLYHQLSRTAPSPIVELNRAVAVGFVDGPAAGLRLLDTIDGLANSHLLHAVRADLLTRLGRTDEARTHLQQATTLTRNTQEHDLLLARTEP